MRRRLSIAARAYIIGISVAAALSAIALSRSPQAGSGVAAVLIITALGAFAHAYPIQGFRHQAYQVTLPFIVLAAALFSGYELLAFIVVIHVAEQLRLHRPLHIQWFNVANYFLSAALAAIIYHRADALLQVGALGHLTAALAAACSFILVNRLLLAGILWLARGLSLLKSGLFEPELLAADLVIAWVAAPMLVVAVAAGSWTVLVTAGPLLLARPALSALLRRHTRPSAVTRAEAPAA